MSLRSVYAAGSVQYSVVLTPNRIPSIHYPHRIRYYPHRIRYYPHCMGLFYQQPLIYPTVAVMYVHICIVTL